MRIDQNAEKPLNQVPFGSGTNQSMCGAAGENLLGLALLALGTGSIGCLLG